MDFSCHEQTPEELAFVVEVREFLAAEWTPERVAEEHVTCDRHHPEFFRALGARGWVMPSWPASRGGADLDDRRLEILEAEHARVSAPTINVATSRMILPAVDAFGSQEVKDEVLSRVTSGRTGISQGYTEPDGGSDIAAARTRAVRLGDSWVLNGSKVYTTGAHHCEYTFLIALTDPHAPRRKGLTMFLVPMSTPGVTVGPLLTLGERTNSVYYNDAVVHDRYRLGEIDDGWRVLNRPLDAEHGIGAGRVRSNPDVALMNARRLALLLDEVVDWSLSATCPRGTPRVDDLDVSEAIGSLLLGVEVAASTSGLTGRIAAAETAVRTASEVMDMIGPDALLRGGPGAGAVERFHRHCQVSTTLGGTVEVFRNLIALELGLPRPAYGALPVPDR